MSEETKVFNMAGLIEPKLESIIKRKPGRPKGKNREGKGLAKGAKARGEVKFYKDLTKYDKEQIKYFRSHLNYSVKTIALKTNYATLAIKRVIEESTEDIEKMRTQPLVEITEKLEKLKLEDQMDVSLMVEKNLSTTTAEITKRLEHPETLSVRDLVWLQEKSYKQKQEMEKNNNKRSSLLSLLKEIPNLKTEDITEAIKYYEPNNKTNRQFEDSGQGGDDKGIEELGEE